MNRNILIVAAHPDDEVLGCGGAIARYTEENDKVHIIFMADGVSSRGSEKLNNGEREERKQAAFSACGVLGVKNLHFLDFPDNRMDTLPLLDIIQPLERLIDEIKPDIVYTHHHCDLNIDHQITHRAVMTACRPLPTQCVKTILAFEVVSSTEWALESEKKFIPNYFITLSCEHVKKKLSAIQAYDKEMRAFPHVRSAENIENLMKVRGASVGVNLCESFEVIRLIN